MILILINSDFKPSCLLRVSSSIRQIPPSLSLGSVDYKDPEVTRGPFRISHILKCQHLKETGDYLVPASQIRSKGEDFWTGETCGLARGLSPRRLLLLPRRRGLLAFLTSV